MTRLLALLSLLLLIPTAWAQWETIDTGFQFQEYNLPGPVEVFVMRLDRSDVTTRAIDSCIGQGQLRGESLANQGRETVSAMAARYDDTINYYYQDWGQRSEVIAAINGDYWEVPYNGRPLSGQIQSGWFARRFRGYSGGSGFFWTIWGVPHMGGNVRNGETSHEQHVVILADSHEEIITEINIELSTDDLVLYTPQWAPHTYTDNSGVEVVVEMSRPNIPLPDPSTVVGTIVEIRNGSGSTPIEFDHVVLSGNGAAATALLNHATVGQQLEIRNFLKDYGVPSTPPLPSADWTKAYAAIGGDRYLVIDSQIPTNTWPTTRDPRTAVAFDDDFVYFVVVDGRSSASIGMSFNELAAFCLNTLGATHAISQDGGGSSAMWVQGKGIVNVPSDGSERATTNGLMMVRVHPRTQSTWLDVNDSVQTASTVAMRLGPGTNYGTLATIPEGEGGVVIDHSLDGVQATGNHWWKCEFGAEVGWLPESALLSTTSVDTGMYYW